MSYRAVMLSLLLLGACAPGRGPYTIGTAGPWRLRHGRNTRLGIQLAVREINGAGGINGHPLIVREVDDEADGRKAVQVAQAFVDNATISAVVGHVTSSAMASAAKVYDGHLTAIATAASSPDLTGISPWVFRVISSDSANGVEMARFANRTGHKRVAILYENDNYGRGLADAFRRSFAGEVVSIDPIAAEARNAEVYVSYFKLRQPDLVFVAGFEASGVAILTEARRQGLQVDFMGGDGWTTLTAHVDVAEGAYVGASFTPTDTRPTAQRFVAAFKRAYHGTEPDGNAALGYDAVRLVAAALAAVGPDRRKIRDWLSSPASSLDGVTGSIRFRPSGDPLGKSVTMTRIARDGALAIAGGMP